MKKFEVTVTIDRPIGYTDAFNNVYSVNYGFIENIIAGDGEYQDAYILSASVVPLEKFSGEVVAIIVRKNDVEDKWVVMSKGEQIDIATIQSKTNFIEQYFDSDILLLV
ncbi:inorganic pyrophosphatase [Listeria weihenstephanensis]|uniref:Inorganic pyrophosphatase n=1 Tax=Listeria weihenstephanensis TaxID=1006155 RepID=A0A841Z698_9LIST|nr:inorganic pyrophosphatase [Listeria weihenstephanensis]MBC1499987.1 inorganic pyrophosphatase [Listeria weihenstephanensis]